ncbi:MAG: DegT/DnrJ/EryC1/StrS family aminotransferase [Vicinamibacterales bacterium]
MASPLAIHGGTPVRTRRMPARLAFVGPDDMQVLDGFLAHYRGRQADFGYQDTYERRYTDAFVRAMGVPGYADAVSTGTAALFVALAAMELPKGARVLVSPITDPGTISAIILNNLVPVLLDSEPGTPNAGPAEVEARWQDGVRAAVLVHAAGQAAAAGPIAEFCRAHDAILLEDCSQAHGARWQGAQVGTFGDVAAFSTMYRKAHATGGCGGVTFSRSETWYRRLRAHADRGKPFWEPGFDDKDPTTFLGPALNFNLDELSCAIGIRSLEKLPETISRRVAFLEYLRERLAAGTQACVGAPVSRDDSPFYYPIRVDRSRLTCGKQEFALAVRAEGIDLNHDYRYVVSEWPWVRPYLDGAKDTPNATAWREEHFNILFNEHFTREEADDIVAAVAKVEAAFLR